MTYYTTILMLDKTGAVMRSLRCLPRYVISGSELQAGVCAAPESYAQRRRAALWCLMDARQRRLRGVAGIAIVSCETAAAARHRPRACIAEYCFKLPRAGLQSGSSGMTTWADLLHHLRSVAPPTSARRKRRATRSRAVTR
jgi:hypothetical protein